MSERIQPTRDKWGLDIPEYGPKIDTPASNREAKAQRLRILGYFAVVTGLSLVKVLDMFDQLPF